ncbi:MAG: carboxylating nicotinate-nucleotide diphosphorylase [Candidatus Omnitrophota bacterium]|nr:carboxylating nicotinate-nucleotide diphosphorylase [Candidatus Omnitrophota bacterium]
MILKIKKSYFPFSAHTRKLLQNSLAEDIGHGDLTSEVLVSRHASGQAVITAREKGIFCGSPVIQELFRLGDSRLSVAFAVKEGRPFRKGQTVATIKGKVFSILKVERTALNFLAHLASIATMTRAYVEAVKPYGVSILDTRKTTPLWREVEKYAVKVGGGKNHRMKLDEAIFVKENHRPYGSIAKLREYPGRFEIEVRNMSEIKQALELVPRIILFDNFTPAQLKKSVQFVRLRRPRCILEASGGITLENVRKYAASGVNWISVGALTHSAVALNFSLAVK